MSTIPAPLAPAAFAEHAVLRVHGADAGSFLQGQLTRDVMALGPHEVGLAALLTPQGRVVAVPWLAREPDGYALVLPTALAGPVGARLARFVLRSKVKLETRALSAALAERIGAAGLAPLALIRAGVPELDLATSEEWIPQMLNLDLLGAISFAKGCYTGQEIVARTQHLGRIKRRMFRLALDGPAPAAKVALLAGAAKVGEVVLSADAADAAECLAVINLEAREAALALADGRPCRRLTLPYAVP